jgi:hypothetical protein
MWLYHKLPYRRIPLILLCKEDWIIHHSFFNNTKFEHTVWGIAGEFGPSGETVEQAIKRAEEMGWTFSSKEGWSPPEQRT